MAKYATRHTVDDGLQTWEIWKWSTIARGHLIECVGVYHDATDCMVALMTLRHEDEGD